MDMTKVSDTSHLEFRGIKQYHEGGIKFGTLYNTLTKRKTEIMLVPVVVLPYAIEFERSLEDRIEDYTSTCTIVNEFCRRFNIPLCNSSEDIEQGVQYIKDVNDIYKEKQIQEELK